MLETKVGQLDEKVFDELLVDAFYWLTNTVGDQSASLNKLNYLKKYSSLKPFTFKHTLSLVWGYNANKLPWRCYDGQYGEYNSLSNSLIIHCSKKFTLGFVLDTLFHEFKHSQQSMYKYQYFEGSYENHPLEKEAEDFAAEWVQIYLKESLIN